MIGSSIATRMAEAADDGASSGPNIQIQLKQLDAEYQALEKEEVALKVALKNLQTEAEALEQAISRPSKKQKLGSAASRTQQEMAAMQNLTNALMGSSSDDDKSDSSSDTES